MKTPEDFINQIDEKFEEAREKRMSRLNLEWGKWSADMNRELREFTEDDNNPGQVIYQYVFIYWVLTSQILELYFVGGILSQIRIKKRMKEIKEVKKVLDLKIPARKISKEEILKMVLEVT